jgi:hypothetical protein
MDILVKYDADLTLKNADGLDALHMACVIGMMIIMVVYL